MNALVSKPESDSSIQNSRKILTSYPFLWLARCLVTGQLGLSGMTLLCSALHITSVSLLFRCSLDFSSGALCADAPWTWIFKMGSELTPSAGWLTSWYHAITEASNQRTNSPVVFGVSLSDTKASV